MVGIGDIPIAAPPIYQLSVVKYCLEAVVVVIEKLTSLRYLAQLFHDGLELLTLTGFNAVVLIITQKCLF